jgi:hypothetical protein
VGRNAIIKPNLVSLAILVGLTVVAGCSNSDNSPAAVQAEKDKMLAPTDLNKLTPEAKAKVEAIMKGNAAGRR